ncbi:MAG: hypothetical protein ABIP55_10575 [Tepidisphaeraceae bacterium]
MFQVLSILAIVMALWLGLMDFAVFRPRRRAAGRDGAVLRGVEWAIYALFLVALAAMTLSGIVMLALGGRMHGWMLILHMSFAPLLAICIAALAVLWAETNASDRVSAVQKFAFWVVILSGFVTITTALLGMMTWFGSGWQETLLNLHRLSSMVLLIAAAYQAARLLPARAAR